jgi:hypothetical protein
VKNVTNVRYDVSEPWSPKVDVVDSFRRSKASLSCCSCARWRLCAGLIGRLEIVIIFGGVLCASIAKLLFEFLVLSTKLSDLIGLLDGAVVVAFTNDELTFLGMSASAARGARLRSIALKRQLANSRGD